MTQEYKLPISFENGFWPTTALVGASRIPNSVRDGRNVWFLGAGLMKSAKGLSGILGVPTNSRMYLVGSQIGSLSTGSVVPYKNGSFWFIGSGSVFVGSFQVGIASSLLTYNTTTNLANARAAGLNAPGAPGLEQGSSGINDGTYAIVITRINSVTGAESNGSLPSAPIAVKNKKIKIIFGGIDGGQDRWGIYGTFKGRATTGPFFFLKEITEASIPGDRRVEIEYYDSQLTSTQPPTDYNPPPQGEFVATLGAHMMVLGTFPGNGVAAGVSPSIANRPEAYPALSTTFLNPCESIVGFAARPTDGQLIVWTKNSLQALVLTGAASFPILPRAIWPTTGIQSPHGGCFADSIFYGYSGKAGPVRLGGEEPDTTFAKPVYEFIRQENWDPATVVVGYDRERDAVIYMGNGVNGAWALPFMRSANDGRMWSTPIQLPGTPQSCLTVEGQLKVTIGGNLYNWEGGNGGDWYLTPAWQDAPEPSDRKTIRGYRGVCNTASAALTLDLLLDLSDTPVTGCTQTTSGSGNRMLPWKLFNKIARQWTVKASATGADHQLYDIQTLIWHEPGVTDK